MLRIFTWTVVVTLMGLGAGVVFFQHRITIQILTLFNIQSAYKAYRDFLWAHASLDLLLIIIFCTCVFLIRYFLSKQSGFVPSKLMVTIKLAVCVLAFAAKVLVIFQQINWQPAHAANWSLDFLFEVKQFKTFSNYALADQVLSYLSNSVYMCVVWAISTFTNAPNISHYRALSMSVATVETSVNDIETEE